MLTLAILSPVAPARGQATANPVTKAGDAFGFRNGDESIGIYNESSVRGFNLEAAGNYRLNGTYFVKSSGVSNFFLEKRTVRIGYNTLAITLPGPSGVVDYELRDPARGEPSLGTVGVDEFNQSYAELFYRHRDSMNRFSAALGANAVFRASDKQGGRGHSLLLAGTIRARLGERGRAQLFFGEYDYERTGQTHVTTRGGLLPQRLPHGLYLGQPWAQEIGARRIAGVLIDRATRTNWSLGATAVFSQDDPHRAFTQLFSNLDSAGRVQAEVIASPHQLYTAWSGELRAIWSNRTEIGRQRLTFTVRGRASRNQFGGDRLVDVGPLTLGEPMPVVDAPDMSSAQARQRSAVDQFGAGASYQLAWREHTNVSAGVLATEYTRAYTDDATVRTRTTSTRLLGNLGMSHAVSRNAELYGSYSKGLEEAGVAPTSARNRGSVLDPILVTQKELGVRIALAAKTTFILAGFNTAKPYAGLDASTSIYRIIGSVRHRGLEASVTGRPLSGATVLVGAMYLQPVLRLAEGSQLTTHAVGVPAVRWTANLNLALPRAPSVSLDAGVEYNGVTPAKTTAVDSASRQAALPPSAIASVGVRSRVALGSAHFTVRALVMNVMNSAYWTVSSSQAFDYGAQRRFRIVVTAER